MRFEIERKFLVVHEGWYAAATSVRHLKDGLIGRSKRGKVRVRLDDDGAWLTVKGERSGGITRPEFEYAIPREDATDMLRTVCNGFLIEKDRFRVPHAGLVWEVDVFKGPLAGIVVAEIELEDEHQPFAKPDWIGEEVTGDLRFRESSLLHLCNTATLPITMEDVLAIPSVIGV